MQRREQRPDWEWLERQGARIEREAGEPQGHCVGRRGAFSVRPGIAFISAAESHRRQRDDEHSNSGRWTGYEGIAIAGRGERTIILAGSSAAVEICCFCSSAQPVAGLVKAAKAGKDAGQLTRLLACGFRETACDAMSAPFPAGRWACQRFRGYRQ